MKKSLIAGVLVALVVSLAGAGAASASEPAFFECAKLAHSEFKNKTCTESGQHGTGKFELKEGVGAKKAISAKVSGLELDAETLSLSCGKSKLAGEVTGADSVGHVLITLSGCKDGASCSSPAAKKGTIVLGPLSGSLGYIDRVSTTVGLDLAPESGLTLGEFGCNATVTPEYQLKGSLFGRMSGDVNAVSKAFDFSVSGKAEGFEGGEAEVLRVLNLQTSEEEAGELEPMIWHGKSPAVEIKA